MYCIPKCKNTHLKGEKVNYAYVAEPSLRVSPLKRIFWLVNVRASLPVLLHKEALALTCFKERLSVEVYLG